MRQAIERGHVKDRLIKFSASAANLTVLWLLFMLFAGRLDVGFALGCVIVSGVWLCVTHAQFGRLLQTYCSLSSRLKVRVPLIGGVALSLLALGAAAFSFAGGATTGIALALFGLTSAAAVAELVGWALLHRQYRRNKAEYEKHGHGPLPKGVLLKPDPYAATPGTFILTAGDLFAPKMHASVDHAELVLRNPKTGRLECFSSWIGHGTVMNPLRRITMGVTQRGSFYIMLLPVQPLTEEENEVLYNICVAMKAQNERAKECVNGWLQWCVGWFTWLPMPQSWKEKLKALKWDGYDYLALISGYRRKHAQTCFGSNLEAWDRMCKEMKKRGRPRPELRHYGMGLFAFGTGLFDPLVVVRLLDDPQLHLLKTEDVGKLAAAKRHGKPEKVEILTSGSTGEPKAVAPGSATPRTDQIAEKT